MQHSINIVMHFESCYKTVIELIKSDFDCIRSLIDMTYISLDLILHNLLQKWIIFKNFLKLQFTPDFHQFEDLFPEVFNDCVTINWVLPVFVAWYGKYLKISFSIFQIHIALQVFNYFSNKEKTWKILFFSHLYTYKHFFAM